MVKRHTKQHKKNIARGMRLSKDIGNVKLRDEDIPAFQGEDKGKIIQLLKAGKTPNQIFRLRDDSGNLVIPGRRKTNLRKFKKTNWYIDKNNKAHSLREIKPLPDTNQNIKVISAITAAVRQTQPRAKIRKPTRSVMIDQIYATEYDSDADAVTNWLKLSIPIKTRLETVTVKPGVQDYEKMAAEGQTRKFQIMIEGVFRNFDTGERQTQKGFTANLKTLGIDYWGEYISQAINNAKYKCGGTNWRLIKLFSIQVIQRDYIL